MFLLVLVGQFCNYFHSICVRFFAFNCRCHHSSYYPFLSQLGSAPPSLSPRASVRHHPYSPLAHDTDDSTHDYQPRRNVCCINKFARKVKGAHNACQNYQRYFQGTWKRREKTYKQMKFIFRYQTRLEREVAETVFAACRVNTKSRGLQHHKAQRCFQ